MNFKDVKNITIPNGVVVKITSKGVVLWLKKGNEPDIPDIPNNEIWYTSIDNTIVTPYTNISGNTLLSNTIDEDGQGKLVFENDLTEIGQEMFDSCYTLQTIILPNSITTIARWPFYLCANLTNITLPDSVTSIEFAAFGLCKSLNQITSLNLIAPTLDKNVFDGLPEVGTLYIPQGATGYDVWLENLPDGWSIQYTGTEDRLKDVDGLGFSATYEITIFRRQLGLEDEGRTWTLEIANRLSLPVD